MNGHGIILARCAGGFLTRIPVAALALSRGGGFTLAERVFMAASWVPKVLLWALKVHGSCYCLRDLGRL